MSEGAGGVVILEFYLKCIYVNVAVWLISWETKAQFGFKKITISHTFKGSCPFTASFSDHN